MRSSRTLTCVRTRSASAARAHLLLRVPPRCSEFSSAPSARGDYALASGFVRQAGVAVQLDWARSYAEAEATLFEGKHAVFVADAEVGMGRGLELIATVAARGIHASGVLLLHGSDPGLEAAAIRAGAASVLVRDEVNAKSFTRHLQQARQRGQVSAATATHHRHATEDAIDHLELCRIRAKRRGTGFAVLAIGWDMPRASRIAIERLGARFFGVVGARIRECLGPRDRVMRVSDAELLVSIEDLPDARGAANTAERITAALSQPLRVGDGDLHVAARVGAAYYPEHADQAQTLYEKAREAMQHARGGDRSQLRMYGHRNRRIGSRPMAIRHHITHALERQEISLHYQPQVDFARGSVVGCEALMRWNSRELGHVSPGEFIPVIEELGLIGRFGEWALEESCRQARAWYDEGHPTQIGVNVSARQFGEPGFLDMVDRVLSDSGIPPKLLELELTESVLLANTEDTRQTLQAVRERGVLVAVDDFGTGFASLSYVKRFPMDVIKIDREFVRNLPLDIENAAITASIVALARSLGAGRHRGGGRDGSRAGVLGCAPMSCRAGLSARAPHAASRALGVARGVQRRARLDPPIELRRRRRMSPRPAWLDALYPDLDLEAGGVLHSTSVARDAAGAHRVIRIDGKNPKSVGDALTLCLTRARAGAVVVSGAVLRAEPELVFDLSLAGEDAPSLREIRRARHGETPLALFVLTGRGIPWTHPAIAAAAAVTIVTSREATFDPAPAHVSIARLDAPSVRGAVALARASHETVAIEAGPRASAALYETPIAVDELLLCRYEGPTLDDARLVDAMPVADDPATSFGALRSETRREEPSGPWRYTRYRGSLGDGG